METDRIRLLSLSHTGQLGGAELGLAQLISHLSGSFPSVLVTGVDADDLGTYAMNLGLMPPTIMVFANGLPNGMWCDSKNGYQELAGIGHDPLQTLTGIGPANWQFYRSVIGVIP